MKSSPFSLDINLDIKVMWFNAQYLTIKCYFLPQTCALFAQIHHFVSLTALLPEYVWLLLSMPRCIFVKNVQVCCFFVFSTNQPASCQTLSGGGCLWESVFFSSSSFSYASVHIHRLRRGKKKRETHLDLLLWLSSAIDNYDIKWVIAHGAKRVMVIAHRGGNELGGL